MDELIERFGGSLYTALVAYKVGPTRVAGILKAPSELPDKDTWYSQYIYVRREPALRLAGRTRTRETGIASWSHADHAGRMTAG